MAAIIYDKDFWIDSQLSIARFYGGININGEFYVIIPQTGDLVRNDWARIYRKIGKEKTLEYIRSGKSASETRKELRSISLSEKERKRARENENGQYGDLFSNNK